jgi:RimJ/RimL family protein N-acetyltransferase
MKKLEFPIKTERLRLRTLELSDLDDLYAYYSREDVSLYLYSKALSKEEVENALKKKTTNIHLQEKGDKLALAVVLSKENKVIGDISLMFTKPEHKGAEIGYIFNPQYQGHGYAIEAAKILLQIGFGYYQFHRIIARCDARNVASYKVMERLGMRREGHFIQNEFVKGEWTDELEYAILREEWQNNNPSKQ